MKNIFFYGAVMLMVTGCSTVEKNYFKVTDIENQIRRFTHDFPKDTCVNVAKIGKEVYEVNGFRAEFARQYCPARKKHHRYLKVYKDDKFVKDAFKNVGCVEVVL